MKKKILITAAALLVLAIAGGWYVYTYIYNKPHPDYLELEAEHIVKDERLFSSFRKDMAEANDLYTGRMIIVEGVIDKVEVQENGVTAVIVMDEGIFGDEGIRFTFLPGQEQAATALETGSFARIKGFCAGYNETDVVVDKSSLVN